MRIGSLAYRVAVLAFAVLGGGAAVSAYVTDSINRFYFPDQYRASTTLFWAGLVVAVVAGFEGVTLILWRRARRTA